MKELSIEEKAKRYDELLVKLQEAKVDNNVCDERYCCVIDDIVPELKESEDERIRKEIIIMEQYISKSALVAEIERRKHKLLDHIICERDKEWAVRTAHQLNRIIMFIDTLEMKEVDLEKENFIKKEIGYIKGYREKAVKMLDELKAQKGE